MRAGYGGSITVEILVAFAVFTLMASAILMVSRGAREAGAASALHQDLRSAAELAHIGVESGHATTLESQYLSSCMRLETAEATSARYSSRFVRYSADVDESRRLGGDCPYWGSGELDISESFSGVVGEEGSALDALAGRVYLGTNVPPYLRTLADSKYATYTNGFSLPAEPNALDAFHVREEDGGAKIYVLAALATSSAQFAIVDATDASKPLLVATSSLAGVVPTGSEPAGWRVLYYDGYAYVTTKETAGPELHVFDVSDPRAPKEVGTGLPINITMNDLAAREDRLYAATSRDSGEIAVYTIGITGALTEMTSLRVDLPGGQDAESIHITGDRLYLGRASNTAGPEFYVFEIRDDALTLLGSVDIPAVSITGIQVAGGNAYLAATPTGISTRRIDVYDVHDPTSLMRVTSRSIPGLSPHGVDVSPRGAYAAGVRDPLLRLIPFD